MKEFDKYVDDVEIVIDGLVSSANLMQAPQMLAILSRLGLIHPEVIIKVLRVELRYLPVTNKIKLSESEGYFAMAFKCAVDAQIR